MSKILLCVDDSVTMQTVAEITFRGSDWEYKGARTAAEARSENGKSPSIILVDNTMPGGSEYDLAQELKSSNPSALVLMLCGNSAAYDEEKGTGAGCDGHIVKPWQTDKIVAKLEEFMEKGPSAAPAKGAMKTPPPLVAPAAPPRSATLMGIPALDMPPPSKPLPAGVASLKSGIPVKKPVLAKKPVLSKPAMPAVKPATPKLPTNLKSPKLPTAKPIAVAKSSTSVRSPMIKKTPGKPIRLVLASQVKTKAHGTAISAGMSSEEATALGSVSREMLEKIIWEVVPDLAEAIIRENLDTLTAKSR